MTLNINLDPLGDIRRMQTNPDVGRSLAIAQGAQGLAQGFQAGQQKDQLVQAQQGALESQQNILNTRDNFIRLERMIGMGGGQEEIEGLLRENIASAESTGGNPIDSVQALNALRAGGVGELARFMNKARPSFEQMGLLPASERKAPDFKILGDISKYEPQSLDLYSQTGKFADLETREQSVMPEDLKVKMRDEFSKQIIDLEEEGRVLQSNFKKVDSLSRQVIAGDRVAAGQLIVAMAKLADPGVSVTDSDAKMVDSAANPVIEAYKIMTEKGVDSNFMNSIIKQIDPLNPEAMNVNSMRETAQSLINANAPVILNQYQRSKQRSLNKIGDTYTGSVFDEVRDDFFYGLPGMEFEALEVADKPEEAPIESGVMSRQEANDRINAISKELGF